MRLLLIHRIAAPEPQPSAAKLELQWSKLRRRNLRAGKARPRVRSEAIFAAGLTAMNAAGNDWVVLVEFWPREPYWREELPGGPNLDAQVAKIRNAGDVHLGAIQFALDDRRAGVVLVGFSAMDLARLEAFYASDFLRNGPL